MNHMNKLSGNPFDNPKSFMIDESRKQLQRKDTELLYFPADINSRYRSQIQHMHEYIYIVNYTKNGDVASTFHSERSYDVTGYTPEEYRKDPGLWFSMIHGEDRDRVNFFLRNIQSTLAPETIEHRIIHKDGSVRWVSNTCSPQIDESGELVALNGFILNITEKKLAEERQQLVLAVLELLNRSGAKKDAIRSILHLMKEHTGIGAVGIRLKEGDDFPFYTTEGFADDFVASESSLSTDVHKPAPPYAEHAAAKLDCMCGAIISGNFDPGSPHFTPYGSFWVNSSEEFRIAAGSGYLKINPRLRCCDEGYESVAHIPLKSGDSIIGLMQLNDRRQGIFSPERIQFFERISASIGISLSHKISDEALRESNERYQSLFENSIAVMLLIDPDTGAILHANQAAAEFYGYGTEKLLQMRISDINILPRERVLKEIEKVINGKSNYFLFKHRLSSGDIRDVEVYTSPIKVQGKTLLQSIIHDITDRKRAEDALKISEEKLRQRNEAIETDLRLAQMIQSKFIPEHAIAHERLKIDFRYLPFEAVGGDYFSFTRLPEGGLGIFIGDVVGHGISAALFLSLLKAATDRVCRLHGQRPGEYLRHLNLELIDYMNSNFITGIYGTIAFDYQRSSTVIFTFSNGAHPYPLLHRRADDHVEMLLSKGSILGFFDNSNYQETSVNLQKGDRIFLYTDGIPEAMNEKGKIIGFDELPDLIRRTSMPDLNGSLEAIIAELNRHRGPVPINDDIVLIGIEIP